MNLNNNEKIFQALTTIERYFQAETIGKSYCNCDEKLLYIPV